MHIVKKEEGLKKDNGALEMPRETKKLIISILNDYLDATPKPEPEPEIDPRKTQEIPNPHINEIADFAQNVLGEILKDGKIPETASLEEIIETYRQLYQKLPHPKDWDPTEKSEEEVAELLIKRFGNIPRHTEENDHSGVRI